MICQLGSMFEIENKMLFIIITPSLYCNIPDCVSKSLYKLWAPVRAPVVTPVPHLSQRSTVPTQRSLYQTFINLENRDHIGAGIFYGKGSPKRGVRMHPWFCNRPMSMCCAILWHPPQCSVWFCHHPGVPYVPIEAHTPFWGVKVHENRFMSHFDTWKMSTWLLNIRKK